MLLRPILILWDTYLRRHSTKMATFTCYYHPMAIFACYYRAMATYTYYYGLRSISWQQNEVYFACSKKTRFSMKKINLNPNPFEVKVKHSLLYRNILTFHSTKNHTYF